MTNTFIQSISLASNAPSITFSNIPQTYTDLYIVYTIRSTRASSADSGYMTFNGISTGYATRWSYTVGNTLYNYSVANNQGLGNINATSATTNTFATGEAYISSYTSSMNKVAIINSVWNEISANSGVHTNTLLWSNSNPITSITIGAGDGNLVAGSNFILYGVSAQTTSISAKAVGGVIEQKDGYIYHTFLNSGTFTPTQIISNAQYLVVAGGGGSSGGAAEPSGGGGAGGLLTGNASFSASSHTITVGAGGSGNTSTNLANSGSNSSISGSVNISSTGGGRAGTGAGGDGANGGSGGGASGWYNGTTAGGTGTAGQGNSGGNTSSAKLSYSSAGGGGAGSSGLDAQDYKGGDGGSGLLIFGKYYAGGGGGGILYSGVTGQGGIGGGGKGCNKEINSPGYNGDNNTGGGAGCSNGSGLGGSGGSGIVIVRYPV